MKDRIASLYQIGTDVFDTGWVLARRGRAFLTHHPKHNAYIYNELKWSAHRRPRKRTDSLVQAQSLLTWISE